MGMLKATMFLSVLVITTLSGCTYVSRDTKSSKEFEGTVTYHEVTKSLSDEFDIDDTAVLHYSHGNYVVIHSSKSSKYHAVKDYYFDNAPIKLFQDNRTDSLHVFPLYFAAEKLDSFKVKQLAEKVFSKNCEEIEVNTSYTEKDSTTYSVIRYVVSKGYLTADKKHFENWKLGFFNKVIDESGALYLKFESLHYDSSHKNILSSKTLQIISVQEGPIDPKIFDYDHAKVAVFQ